MNATQLATDAYGAATLPIRSARSAEHDVLARITARLKAANRSGSFPLLAGALAENRRIWTLFASDVAGEENGLPQALRAQIFYLAEFTEQHTRKVLQGQETPEALIDINASVLCGLRGDWGQE